MSLAGVLEIGAREIGTKVAEEGVELATKGGVSQGIDTLSPGEIARKRSADYANDLLIDGLHQIPILDPVFKTGDKITGGIAEDITGTKAVIEDIERGKNIKDAVKEHFKEEDEGGFHNGVKQLENLDYKPSEQEQELTKKLITRQDKIFEIINKYRKIAREGPEKYPEGLDSEGLKEKMNEEIQKAYGKDPDTGKTIADEMKEHKINFHKHVYDYPKKGEPITKKQRENVFRAIEKDLETHTNGGSADNPRYRNSARESALYTKSHKLRIKKFLNFDGELKNGNIYIDKNGALKVFGESNEDVASADKSSKKISVSTYKDIVADIVANSKRIPEDTKKMLLEDLGPAKTPSDSVSKAKNVGQEGFIKSSTEPVPKEHLRDPETKAQFDAIRKQMGDLGDLTSSELMKPSNELGEKYMTKEHVNTLIPDFEKEAVTSKTSPEFIKSETPQIPEKDKGLIKGIGGKLGRDGEIINYNDLTQEQIKKLENLKKKNPNISIKSPAKVRAEKYIKMIESKDPKNITDDEKGFIKNANISGFNYDNRNVTVAQQKAFDKFKPEEAEIKSKTDKKLPARLTENKPMTISDLNKKADSLKKEPVEQPQQPPTTPTTPTTPTNPKGSLQQRGSTSTTQTTVDPKEERRLQRLEEQRLKNVEEKNKRLDKQREAQVRKQQKELDEKSKENAIINKENAIKKYGMKESEYLSNEVFNPISMKGIIGEELSQDTIDKLRPIAEGFDFEKPPEGITDSHISAIQKDIETKAKLRRDQLELFNIIDPDLGISGTAIKTEGATFGSLSEKMRGTPGPIKEKTGTTFSTESLQDLEDIAKREKLQKQTIPINVEKGLPNKSLNKSEGLVEKGLVGKGKPNKSEGLVGKGKGPFEMDLPEFVKQRKDGTLFISDLDEVMALPKDSTQFQEIEELIGKDNLEAMFKKSEADDVEFFKKSADKVDPKLNALSRMFNQDDEIIDIPENIKKDPELLSKFKEGAGNIIKTLSESPENEGKSMLDLVKDNKGKILAGGLATAVATGVIAEESKIGDSVEALTTATKEGTGTITKTITSDGDSIKKKLEELKDNENGNTAIAQVITNADNAVKNNKDDPAGDNEREQILNGMKDIERQIQQLVGLQNSRSNTITQINDPTPDASTNRANRRRLKNIEFELQSGRRVLNRKAQQLSTDLEVVDRRRRMRKNQKDAIQQAKDTKNKKLEDALTSGVLKQSQPVINIVNNNQSKFDNLRDYNVGTR